MTSTTMCIKLIEIGMRQRKEKEKEKEKEDIRPKSWKESYTLGELAKPKDGGIK